MAETYTTDDVQAKLADYPGWELGDDGQLHKTFTLKNFGTAMLFAGAVGHYAEIANHHPDIFIHSWKNVRISLMSHDVGGITDRDFALVAQIEALPLYE